LKRARYVFSALFAVLVFGCSDDPPGGNGGGGDGGGDQGDAAGDQGGTDNGGTDNGGTDNGTDNGGGGDTADGDTGGGAFPSCVVNPAGEICGNGFDDNCDGRVDERCGCSPDGATQSCYLGAPSDLGHASGRCQAGTQTCRFEFWDECVGAIGPIAEICGNNIDDDCDGIIDNPELCDLQGPVAICPADFEDAVLSTYTLLGSWALEEGDEIVAFFWTQISAPPGHSRDIRSSGDTITFFADVAGQYTFEFFVQSDFGEDTCRTIFTAGTLDALRIEMFWNPDYNEAEGLPRDRSDFDLYLLRNPDTGGGVCQGDSDCPGWDGSFVNGQVCNTATNRCEFYYYRDATTLSSPRRGHPNVDSCHWRNCNTCPSGIENLPEYEEHQCQDLRAVDIELVRECLCRYRISNPPAEVSPGDIWPEPTLEWGAPDTPETDPRLDLDDTEGKGPENINVRRPDAGTYRVAVHMFKPDTFGTPVGEGLFTNPVQVWILCEGVPVYASDQVVLRGSDGFQGHWVGDLWEVGDLVVTYEADTIQCDFQPFEELDDCPRVCTLQQSDGGCSESERRACD
jgi:hypothetical protein